MSEPPPTPAEDTPVLKGSAIPKIIVAVSLGVALLLGALWAGARYGVLLPQARVMIEARADGLKIGRMGRLEIEGLAGDLWRDFSIRRLTIRDENGVWLEANNVNISWRYVDLLQRRFTADRIEARSECKHFAWTYALTEQRLATTKAAAAQADCERKASLWEQAFEETISRANNVTMQADGGLLIKGAGGEVELKRS